MLAQHKKLLLNQETNFKSLTTKDLTTIGKKALLGDSLKAFLALTNNVKRSALLTKVYSGVKPGVNRGRQGPF